jgi:hypothetical protein
LTSTLAAYRRSADDAVLVDEHVEPLNSDDHPDLVAIQVYITNADRDSSDILLPWSRGTGRLRFDL